MNALSNSYIYLLSCLVMVIGCTQQADNKVSDNTEQKAYAESALEIDPILTGTKIPDASVKNVTGESVRLHDLIKEKPTVLIFYRGGWCPYCSKHMARLQEIEAELVQMGYQIAAISTDRPQFLQQSIEEHDLNYSLYSDSPMNASTAFGLAYKVDDETVNRYKKNGLDLEKRSGYDHHLLPVPAVYIIDQSGEIKFQYLNPDYKKRIEPEVLLAAARAYHPDSES